MLGEATCPRSARDPTRFGFHLGDAVQAHAHLVPSLLLSCRTCLSACAGCPVGSSVGLRNMHFSFSGVGSAGRACLRVRSTLPCRSAMVRLRSRPPSCTAVSFEYLPSYCILLYFWTCVSCQQPRIDAISLARSRILRQTFSPSVCFHQSSNAIELPCSQ